MKVVVIRHNAGNVESVMNALYRLGMQPEVTDDAEKITRADKVIFPGVGEASTTMAYLRERNLDVILKGLTMPVLGICLGLQLMCSRSEEGDTTCLGIFDEEVKRFAPLPGKEYITKVPHMGWNRISDLKGPVFRLPPNNRYVYFVHSYYAEIGIQTTAVTDYIVPFSAALQKDNFFATQFHPEKSGTLGSDILSEFLKL